jgi:type IV fimbrial biogenesis protein FimT
LRASPAARRSAGFTLVETLTAMTVLALLLSVGVPGLNGFVARQSVATASEAFAQSLQVARVESARRNTPVTVCRLLGGDPSIPACASADQDWSGGWVVFADRGTAGVIDADDDVLAVHGPLASVRVEQEGAGRPAAFTFSPIGPVQGFSGSAWGVRFAALSPSSSYARSTCLGLMGRVYTQEAEAACR